MLWLQYIFLALKKGFNTFKKYAIIGIVVYIIINLFMIFAFKAFSGDKKQQVDVREKSRETIYKAINDPELNKTKEVKIAMAGYRVLICRFIGEGCSSNPDDKANNYNESILGQTSGLVTLTLTHPPASGVYWTYNGLANAGFVPKIQAAEGIGFSALEPYRKIWAIFRDICLMLITIIMVITGFLIMFRFKINQQTVISVENALPRLAISLILITFSYAIAGFLIDAMYVLIALLITLLSSNDTLYNSAEMQQQYLSGGFGTIFQGLFPVNMLEGWASSFMMTSIPILKVIPGIAEGLQLFTLGDSILGIMPDMIRGFVNLIGFIGAMFVLEKIFQIGEQTIDALDDTTISVLGIGGSLGGIPGAVIGFFIIVITVFALVPILVPFLIGLLIFFTILFALFRIFFMLLFAYIRILLLIIISPVFMVLEAIPGRGSFSWWIKALISEMITFPVTIGLFLVAYIIVNYSASGDEAIHASTQSYWAPPLLYDLNQKAFIFLIGFGLTLIIPQIVKLVKELMGVKAMPPLFGVGTFFGGVGTAVQGATGLMGQFHSIKTFWKGTADFGTDKDRGASGFFSNVFKRTPVSPEGDKK